MELIEIGIKHRILCHIAKHLHINLKRSISKPKLYNLIQQYAIKRGQPFNVQQIVDEILDQIGLLYLTDKDEVEFKHQSFQEYFTAFEIFHHRQTDRRLFIDKFNDLWWQNVAIFYAGMSKDSPQLIEEIIKKSMPTNLFECISNTGGIGKLLQALYNTPIEQRKKGIQRGLDNTNNVLKLILQEDDKNFEFWKKFSKYGLMQIFGGWFKHNNWSITLKEPLSQQFDENFYKIEIERLNKEELFNIEFQLFLISSILASDTFVDFERFKRLVDKSKFLDINILAICDTHFKLLKKHLPKSYRKEDDLKIIKKKLRKKIQSIPDFASKVNTPIKHLKIEG